MRVHRAVARPAARDRAAVLLAAVGGILAALLVLAAAPAASAHAELVSSDPADGATLAAAPAAVTLTFSETLLPGAEQLAATVDGTPVALGAVRLDGRRVSAAWPDGAPGGRAEVSYRVVSDDGHVVSGTLRFVVPGVPTSPAATTAAAGTADPGAGPGSPAAAPQDPAPAADGVPVWLVVVASVVAMAVGSGIAVVMARRSAARGGPSGPAGPGAPGAPGAPGGTA